MLAPVKADAELYLLTRCRVLDARQHQLSIHTAEFDLGFHSCTRQLLGKACMALIVSPFRLCGAALGLLAFFR